MSDTPRTDKATYRCIGPYVESDFARTLERELAAMTKDRDSWRQQNYDRVGDLFKVSGKRDRLLAELSAMTKERDERDELRAKMECYDPYFRELDLLRHERDGLKAECDALSNLLWEHPTAPCDQNSIWESMKRVQALYHERDALRAELAQFQQPTHQEQETT